MNAVNVGNPLVLVVFGASGSGKTTLVHELQRARPDISVHAKGTDRAPRRYDSSEILCRREVTHQEYDYIYSQYGHRYGIQRSQIDAAVKEGRHHLIVCNDVETIEAIRRDYGERVRVVFMLFDAPDETLLAIQKARHIPDDEITLRVQKIQILNQTFLNRYQLFDGVILNKFESPRAHMMMQLDRIIAAEEHPAGTPIRHEPSPELMEIAEAVSRIRTSIEQHPALGRAVAQRDYLFILMAMRVKDPLLEDAHAAIKRAAATLGIRAERVDEIVFSGQITDKILGSIRCAEYVVADLTHERPNVYYELGYAHALGKRTILVARAGTRLHFDVQNYRVEFYPSGERLEGFLADWLGKMKRSGNGQTLSPGTIA